MELAGEIEVDVAELGPQSGASEEAADVSHGTESPSLGISWESTPANGQDSPSLAGARTSSHLPKRIVHVRLDAPSQFPKLDVAHYSSPVLRDMHLCSGCEHNRSVLGHDDGVFELGDETAVDCAQRPAVLSLYNFIRRRR